MLATRIASLAALRWTSEVKASSLMKSATVNPIPAA